VTKVEISIVDKSLEAASGLCDRVLTGIAEVLPVSAFFRRYELTAKRSETNLVV
jgi:hypothetical protein